jgi:hypothetical protein
LNVLRSTIDANTASASASGLRDPRGSGIFAQGEATIVNTFVHRNTSAGLINPVGGAVYLGSTGRLIHVTIADNTGHGLTAASAGVEVVNSIVWRNAPLQISGMPTVGFSNVEGGFPGNGVTAINPLFIVRDPTLPGYNVHLDRTSPLVDRGTSAAAGLPTDDVDAQPRPQGAGFDMGADEVTQFTDHPVVASVTVVRAIHVQELRDRIDVLRAARDLPAFVWSDTALSPRVTPVMALHITELRDALAAIFLADGLEVPRYTNSTISTGAAIKAVDINELREAVVQAEHTAG